MYFPATSMKCIPKRPKRMTSSWARSRFKEETDTHKGTCAAPLLLLLVESEVGSADVDAARSL